MSEYMDDDFPEIVQDISNYIREKLRGLPPTSHCKPTIFKVGGTLNPKFHEPQVVSIGPYHHGKDHLQKMEQEKLRCFMQLVDRQKESRIDTIREYVNAIMLVEGKARECYSKPVEFSRDMFVQMLLIDGCFIAELIRKYKIDELRDGDGIMILHQSPQLCHDLMLFENQVPFFVLDQCFNMTKTGNPNDDFLFLIRSFINGNSAWPAAKQPIVEVSMENVDHLLGLVKRMLCSSRDRLVRAKEAGRLSIDLTCSELTKEGIKFDNCKKSNFLDIDFIKGTLIIPQFLVSQETEAIFRNLLTYERFLDDAHPCYVSDYVIFMNSLLRTSEDVGVLRRSWILGDFLGIGDTVYDMFGRLAREITWPSESSYGDVYEKVFQYRDRRSALPFSWLALPFSWLGR